MTPSIHKTITAHNTRVSHTRHSTTRTILYTSLISSLTTILLTAVYIDVAILK